MSEERERTEELPLEKRRDLMTLKKIFKIIYLSQLFKKNFHQNSRYMMSEIQWEVTMVL